MSRRLDDYLSSVARHLRHLPASVRENEVREMRSHLEQLRDDFAAQGQNPEMAAQSALDQFGEARAVGIHLRDVWEGQDFSWQRTLTAFFIGLLFWFGAMSCMEFGVKVFQRWPQSALFPIEMRLVLGSCFTLIPALTGTIHAFYLGRRAWMMSLAVYGLLWGVEVVSGSSPSLTIGNSEMSIWSWSLICGLVGACLSDALLRRRRHATLSLAGAASSGSVAEGALPCRSGKTKFAWKTFVAVTLVLALALSGGVHRRLNAAMHPQDAFDAVLTKLLLSRDATKMESPDPIRLEEVAPTPAELAAGTRRIRFQTQSHMTREYQKRRLDFLQAQLATASGRKRWGEANLRAALKRVRANSFPISGVVRVKNTPSGWQVQQKSFNWSLLHDWAEDIYFDH